MGSVQPDEVRRLDWEPRDLNPAASPDKLSDSGLLHSSLGSLNLGYENFGRQSGRSDRPNLVSLSDSTTAPGHVSLTVLSVRVHAPVGRMLHKEMQTCVAPRLARPNPECTMAATRDGSFYVSAGRAVWTRCCCILWM